MGEAGGGVLHSTGLMFWEENVESQQMGCCRHGDAAHVH
jgi:hypothetical protein